MNFEEKKEKLFFMQKYFVKSFWLSFILLLIASFLCVVMHDFQLALTQKYFKMNVEDFNYLVVLILGIWKILIIQFTLVPALVLWCMKKCCKNECKQD